MLSYWEKTSFLHYDYIIVGSGIVGMNTAIELKEKHPKSKVLILERSIFPYGASSRNAGFACVGSISEYLDDKSESYEQNIFSLFQKRYHGLQLLRKRLGDDKISFRQQGSYELLSENELHVLDHIDQFNKLLLPISKKETYKENTTYISTSGMDKSYFKACIECTIDGELHTGHLLNTLHELCLERGVIIKTGVNVNKFEASNTNAHVEIFDSSRQENITLSCSQLILCTNAFTAQFIPDIDIIPGRGQVLITHPIPDLNVKGIHHFDSGYYYFRAIDNRILFGGGRHLDFEKEASTEMVINTRIVSELKSILQLHILPHHDLQIDMTWTGIMAFGANKLPIVQKVNDRVWCAARLGGMGVALGALIAKELVEDIMNN